MGEPILRITHLLSPPVVGKRYLVPTVNHKWLGDRFRPWPVFLPLHRDAEFFDFADEHYHIDPRFVGKRDWDQIGRGWGGKVRDERKAFQKCQATPVARHRYGPGAVDLPPIVWRTLVCKRPEAIYSYSDKRPVLELNDHFRGQACKAAHAGWVCPHQGFPLGSITPDSDGVITCPLHGLRIVAATGEVAQAVPAPPPAPPTFFEALMA